MVPVAAPSSALRAGGLARPAASACAREEMPAMSARTGAPFSSWVISSGSAATAARRVSMIAGERTRVLSSTRLTRFSIDQANSPRSRAPTMRPLPFRVCSERRTVTRASRSSGFSSHTGKLWRILASSSCASSMNSFTSSGSACSASAGSFAAGEAASVGAAASTAAASGRTGTACMAVVLICTVLA